MQIRNLPVIIICMNITLSNKGNLRNFSNFVKNNLDFSNKSYLNIEIPDRVSFHPVHLVLLVSLAMKVGKENVRLSGNIEEIEERLYRYGIFDFVSNLPSKNYDKEKELSGSIIPITLIRTAKEQSKFIADLVPLLHLKEHDAKIVKYIFGELIRNVLEHSFARDGAVVAARYNREENRFSIAICDSGRGIWKSINENWNPKDDVEAIQLCLTPGKTGTTKKEGGTDENAGAGLFFIKSMASITRSYFVIYSGRAEYTLNKHRPDIKSLKINADPFKDRHTLLRRAPDFQGTLVGVDILLNETPEFKSLLGVIGDTYRLAIRERKRNYRKARFI